MFGAIAGAVVGTVVAGAMGDDYGAEGANDAQAALTREQAAIARENQEEYKSYYRPLERGLLKEVNKYGTPEYRDRLAGEYKSAVSGAYSDADKNAFESLRARGVDPTSGNALGIQGSLGLEKAAAMAGADRQATRDAEDNYWAKGLSMAQHGRGFQVNAQQGMASAASGLNSVIQNANQMTANRAYAVAPVANALSQGVQKYVNDNASSWFGSGNKADVTAGTNMGYGKATPDSFMVSKYVKGGKVKRKGLAKLADGGTTHTGVVSGPGDGTVDTVPAVLADGEHVVNAEAVRIIGRDVLDAVNMIGLMKRYKKEQREAA